MSVRRHGARPSLRTPEDGRGRWPLWWTAALRRLHGGLPLVAFRPLRPLLIFSSGLNPEGGSAARLSFHFSVEAALAAWARRAALTPTQTLAAKGTAAVGAPCFTLTNGPRWDVSPPGDEGVAAGPQGLAALLRPSPHGWCGRAFPLRVPTGCPFWGHTGLRGLSPGLGGGGSSGALDC